MKNCKYKFNESVINCHKRSEKFRGILLEDKVKLRKMLAIIRSKLILHDSPEVSTLGSTLLAEFTKDRFIRFH